MWKQILSVFKGGGLYQEAFEEALLMVQSVSQHAPGLRGRPA